MIHCAASVDFDAPLSEAIQQNILGTLKLFRLGEEAKHLQNFVHVSTCYVNCVRPGFIEEKVYFENPNFKAQERLD